MYRGQRILREICIYSPFYIDLLSTYRQFFLISNLAALISVNGLKHHKENCNSSPNLDFELIYKLEHRFFKNSQLNGSNILPANSHFLANIVF